jgi:phosphate acetyltransferase
MKIIFPELSSNQIAKESIKQFKDIEFIPAESLEQAAAILETDKTDSMISGLDYSSRDVLLAYKNHIPLKSSYFSSCFICQKGNKIFALADGGVNKLPSKEHLYTIIEDTAKTFQTYTNHRPKIALLSYSTHGSGGKNPDLVKYQFCLDQIKANHPDWIIDGELQLDAAINPTVANKKAPNSPLKGNANILITPDLNSGNILYKSLEQFGGFTIAGPIIQGFQIPLADLSRGSTTDDTVLTIKVLRSLL